MYEKIMKQARAKREQLKMEFEMDIDCPTEPDPGRDAPQKPRAFRICDGQTVITREITDDGVSMLAAATVRLAGGGSGRRMHLCFESDNHTLEIML
jgi:hypothetical protein